MKSNVTITSHDLILLVKQTYEFISTSSRLTDDDILYVAQTLAELIEKTKVLKS